MHSSPMMQNCNAKVNVFILAFLFIFKIVYSLLIKWNNLGY